MRSLFQAPAPTGVLPVSNKPHPPRPSVPHKPDSVTVAQRPLVHMSAPVTYSSLANNFPQQQQKKMTTKTTVAKSYASSPAPPPPERKQDEVRKDFERQLLQGKAMLKSYHNGNGNGASRNGNDDADSGISLINGASPPHNHSPPPPPPPPPPPQFDDFDFRGDSPPTLPPTVPPPPPIADINRGGRIPPAPK